MTKKYIIILSVILLLLTNYACEFNNASNYYIQNKLPSTINVETFAFTATVGAKKFTLSTNEQLLMGMDTLQHPTNVFTRIIIWRSNFIVYDSTNAGADFTPLDSSGYEWTLYVTSKLLINFTNTQNTQQSNTDSDF